jgi:hypothetical protein
MGAKIVFVSFAVLAAFAQADRDAAVGTWRFDAAASTYESGPAPRESTRVFEVAGDRIRFVHTGISANGQPFRTEYTAGYDGADYPVEGSARYDTVSQKMIDSHNIDLVFRLKGEVTVITRRTISADGQRMTVVAEGANPDGKRFRNVLIYKREASFR